MYIVFTSFKHPKLPVSIKIPATLLQSVCICIHESYISKFEFKNYHFANLLVAWLYEPVHNKVNTSTLHTAKTQIRLGIRPVCLESLLCTQRVAKGTRCLHGFREYSNQIRCISLLLLVIDGYTCTSKIKKIVSVNRDGVTNV